VSEARLSTGLVRLDIGEPDLPTPEHVIAAIEEALRSGLTRYGPPEGILELRRAVCEHLALFGVDAHLDEVLITPGASFAIYLALKALLRPGDEVLLPTPTWFVYPDLVEVVGGRCTFVRPGPGLRPDVETLAEAVSPRTRVLVVNTPNNPVGYVLRADEVRALAELAVDHGLFVVSDEVYKMITYDGLKHVSFASLPELRERLVLVDSFSKAYRMTGWRLGYLVAPRELRDKIVRIQAALLACVPPFVQQAGLAALRGPQEHVREMVAEYQARRDLLLDLLSRLPDVRVVKPEGSFYAFPDLSAYGVKASILVARLEQEHGVRLKPGDAFGPWWDYHVRISFCRAREELVKGVEKLATLLESLG